MVTVENAIIAHFEKSGKRFEILVDPELAYSMKEGKTISINKMLAANFVFTDARKANRASPSDVEKTFGTHDIEKIADYIIKNGEMQLTTDFRRKKIDERKKQIAAFISKNAINPQTKLPHPQERVLSAMESAHLNIDPFRSAEHQVNDVMKAIKGILPISLEETVLQVEISAQYASRVYGILKEYVKEQAWNQGALAVRIAIPAGMRETIYKKVGSISDGTAKITEVKNDGK